jgi:acyl-[acyl-carrier-protein] desaturase
VTPSALLGELALTVDELLERHDASARPWSTYDFFQQLRDEAAPPGPLGREEPLFSALWVNILTEDNLPHYFHLAASLFETSKPWKRWTDRWLAEESRHSIALRDLVLFRGWLPSEQLEAARLRQLRAGWSSAFIASPLQLVIYAAIQELATRVSHRNTQSLVDDEVGRALLRRIVADENSHFLFYRDLVVEALRRWPSEVVIELDHQVRNFRMPGVGTEDFDVHSRRMADAHVYDIPIHVDRILRPLLQYWHLDDLEGLDPPAEAARARVVGFVDRLSRAARLHGRRAGPPAASATIAVGGGRP